jgi:hypothetical protein
MLKFLSYTMLSLVKMRVFSSIVPARSVGNFTCHHGVWRQMVDMAKICRQVQRAYLDDLHKACSQRVEMHDPQSTTQ